MIERPSEQWTSVTPQTALIWINEGMLKIRIIVLKYYN
jgi:hypothetical protein